MVDKKSTAAIVQPRLGHCVSAGDLEELRSKHVSPAPRTAADGSRAPVQMLGGRIAAGVGGEDPQEGRHS